MEVPLQYKAIVELRIISTQRRRSPGVQPLLPPPKVLQMDSQGYERHNAPQPPILGMSMEVQNCGYPSTPQAPPVPSPTSGNYDTLPAPNAYGQYGGGYYLPNAPLLASISFPTTRAVDEEITKCHVCLLDKDTAFNCGHQTCHQYSSNLINCPICRAPITTRIRLN